MSSAETLNHGEGLVQLLDELRADGVPDQAALATLVRQKVGVESSDTFEADLARARDSVVAAYLLNDDGSGVAPVELVRAYQIASDALAGTSDRTRIESMLKGALALPDFFARAPETRSDEIPSVEDTARQLADQINDLSVRHERLTAAISELETHAEDELEVEEAGSRSPLFDLYRDRRPESEPRPPRERQPVAEEDIQPEQSSMLRAAIGKNVMLSAHALELTPNGVLDTLRDLDLDPSQNSVRDLQTGLVKAQIETGMKLLELAGQFAKVWPIEYKGGVLRPMPTIPIPSQWWLDPVDDPDVAPSVATSAPNATPTPVRPLGVADLLLVRSHISHYERSGVAAIENVLPHDIVTHTTQSLDTTETTSTTETEHTDLRSMTQSTAEDQSERATVQASGAGIGPVAADAPESFARSVTDQVSSTSTSRTRQTVVERRLRQREETLQHALTNSGTETATGIYQWLDEVHEARIFSLGSRLLYDMIIPEPAALFGEALARPRTGLPLPTRPAPFRLRPDALTSHNWAYYAAGHHATGVEAPPPQQVVVTEAFPGKQAKDRFATDDLASSTLTWAETRKTLIPKGYEAKRFVVKVIGTGSGDGQVQVSIGTAYIYRHWSVKKHTWRGALEGERESIPVGLDVSSFSEDDRIYDVAVTVEIICEATEELMSAWQVKAYGQILEANQRRFEEYAEAVATRDAAARLTLQAMPQTRKANIIATEVKRTALSYLTGQSFAGFNATALDSAGFPYPDVSATNALSAYARFLEQAIEWNYVAYAFLPYFWGAQTSWIAKLLTTEPDRQFGDFLTSGAARVVLPVRLGFENAFERFLFERAVPSTDELLDVGSPLWVSLTDQLKSEGSPEGEETPVDEPWTFRIASDLMLARRDGSMPKWTFDQNTWTDVADPNF